MPLSHLRESISPLPLAGEGWGERHLVRGSARPRDLASSLKRTLTLPSPASGRGESQLGSMCRTSSRKRSRAVPLVDFELIQRTQRGRRRHELDRVEHDRLDRVRRRHRRAVEAADVSRRRRATTRRGTRCRTPVPQTPVPTVRRSAARSRARSRNPAAPSSPSLHSTRSSSSGAMRVRATASNSAAKRSRFASERLRPAAIAWPPKRAIRPGQRASTSASASRR